MPVTTEHPEYIVHKDEWDRIHDCLAGSDAVKASALKYLPMLSGQERDMRAYGVYVTRALWYSGIERIRDALVGAIFRKVPHCVMPARLLPRERSINNAADNIYTFTKRVATEVVSFGRAGLLVDLPTTPGSLPYVTVYDARSIRSWRTIRKDDGSVIIDQIILFEEFSERAEDGFGSSIKGQFRVLELDADGLYQVRIFRAMNGYPDTMGPFVNTPYMMGQMINITKQPTPSYVNATNQPGVYEEIDVIQPTPANGQRIDYIPFSFINCTDLRPDVQKSPLLEIANISLSHFRSSADLESARHLTAFPVPYITGMDESSKVEWKVGGDAVWLLPEGCAVGMLEYHGQGLIFLENALTQKENYLALLGARILDAPKKGTETAQAMAIRQGPEHASLTSIAHTISDGFESALRTMAAWIGESPDSVQFELNTDFMEQPLDADTLKTLMLAVTQGLMPVDEFVWNLQRGEMVRPEKSIEEIRDEIDKDMAKMMPLMGGMPGANSAQEGGANFGAAGTKAGVQGAGMGNPRKPKQPVMGGPQAPRPVVGKSAGAKANA